MILIDGIRFELADFEKSSTAKRKGIDNRLKGDDILDYQYLMDIIIKIQAKFGKPIYVNSGYRSKDLNKAVGGATKSQHRSLGNEAAADITAGNKLLNKELYSLIRQMVNSNEIILDQIIDEKVLTWIHVSVKRNGVNRKQFLKL
ncbi:MAG: D-Ala-D-Ala carboxypeptidase family metallohydrolase [Bacteroidales bacterium]